MRLLRRDKAIRNMFETRSHSWQEVGLAKQLNSQRVRRAQREVVVLLVLIAGVIFVYSERKMLFGVDVPVRIATAIVLVILGWAFARDVGRSLGPALFRRLDPGTAGTVGFLIRLVTIAIAVLIALRIAGLKPATLLAGGAFTAVIIGLAAQQTLSHLIAGTVLLSARPFRVGERIRLEGGGYSGLEGVVSSLGLMYTTLASGDDSLMIPNSTLLNIAVVPLREPQKVDLRARLQRGLRPTDVQERLDTALDIPVRGQTSITLEEIDGDEVVVRIEATPAVPSDGPRLADEIVAVLETLTREAETRRGEEAGAS